jgi:hypothetical protein
MPIIVAQKGVLSASVVEKSDFEDDDNFQEYIHDHPETIPVHEVHRDKRLLVVAREFKTQSGPGWTCSGIATLVVQFVRSSSALASGGQQTASYWVVARIEMIQGKVESSCSNRHRLGAIGS